MTPVDEADKQQDRGTPAKPAAVRKEVVELLMLKTATRLFAERGFAGTSLQDIADAMGVTRPALYYYVKSKDDLLQKIVTDASEGYTSQIADVAINPELDSATKISKIAYLVAYDRALQPSRFLLLARSEGELPQELATIHESASRTIMCSVVRVIKDGIDAGQFRPVNPRRAAFEVIGMCNWIAWWFHEDETSTAEEVANDVADLAVGCLFQAPLPAVPASGARAAVALIRRDLDYLENLLDEADSSTAATDRP